MFKKYLRYLANNPRGYWFKRKLYGWGWVPVKWQGWVVTALFILFIIWNNMDLMSNPNPSREQILWFLFKIFVAMVAIIGVCYKTGEKPHWQWGHRA